ncbi:MAG: iron ABC transporter permease [Fimbriimonadaceae bacterium]|nr:iron ABC transporter permease [Fimbriimonadaceae bacterium]
MMVPLTVVGTSRRAWATVSVALGVALLAHIVIGGAMGADLTGAWRAFLGRDSVWSSVLWDIRLPRALACVFVGAILGSSGAAFQLLFRNPLAEPFVIGVSGGAAVMVTAFMSLGLTGLTLELGSILAAIIGGFGALSLVLTLASMRRGFRSESVLIAGAVVSSMLLSLMTVVLLSTGKDSSEIVRWMLGSASPMYWSRVAILFVTLMSGGWALLRECRRLNALSLGELSARSLGVDPQRSGRTVLLAVTVMASIAVGATGIIGFLGIIAPNISRRIVGPDARLVVPLSGCLAACLLLAADLIAQRALPGQELPVGAVTAVLGAPALLWVLKR